VRSFFFSSEEQRSASSVDRGGSLHADRNGQKCCRGDSGGGHGRPPLIPRRRHGRQPAGDAQEVHRLPVHPERPTGQPFRLVGRLRRVSRQMVPPEAIGRMLTAADRTEAGSFTRPE